MRELISILLVCVMRITALVGCGNSTASNTAGGRSKQAEATSGIDFIIKEA